ncbi:MAG: hypothetical protein JW991_03595 [Candidatus Pacebacteria bacterium]|nr:hypothetical protein [Candidatus Paceibacterota bacterium]
MILKKLAKLKRGLALLLLVILLPLSAKPALAYDSTPFKAINFLGVIGDTETGLLEYYADVFHPALESPEMNLESFVSETFKALFLGIPIYYLTRIELINCLYWGVLCSHKVFSGDIADFGDCLNVVPYCADAALWFVENKEPLPIAGLESGILTRTLTMTRLISQKMPVSGFRYFSWLGQKVGLSQPAQAQGFGYNSMAGLIPWWTVFRNAAYALFAVAAVIIGFMIMFRTKLDPRTVVTIQQALPKMIITLLLVTFSYAIVGLIMDLIWFSTLFAYEIVSSVGDFRNTLAYDGFRRGLMERSAFGYSMWRILPNSFIASFVGLANAAQAVFGGPAGLTEQGLMVIGWFILAAILLWTAIKTTWMIIKAFIFLVLYTIVAPLWIFMDVFPGSKAFNGWLKNVMAQAVTFPVTGTLFVLSSIFMGGARGEIPIGLEARAHEIRLPLMGEFSPEHALQILGLGMFFYAPKIAEMAQSMLKAGLGGRDTAIGEAVGPISSGAQGYLGHRADIQQQLVRNVPAGSTYEAEFAKLKKLQAAQRIGQQIGGLFRG